MPTAHDQIESDREYVLWRVELAEGFLAVARAYGTEDDIAVVEDYADEQRDRLRADDRKPDPYQVLAALDYGDDDDSHAANS